MYVLRYYGLYGENLRVNCLEYTHRIPKLVISSETAIHYMP